VTVACTLLQIALAEESLKAETNADVVRDVKVKLQPVRRRARIVYFPAYIAQYTFGEVLAMTGERRLQRFLSVISGMGEPHVAKRQAVSGRTAAAKIVSSTAGAATESGGLQKSTVPDTRKPTAAIGSVLLLNRSHACSSF